MNPTEHALHLELPGEHLDSRRMPGHWLLARIGKRVLRPGGLELTRKMIAALGIGAWDDVVEFAPGLGITARMALSRKPRSYRAVERDRKAAAQTERAIAGYPNTGCRYASADETGMPAGTASIVYGEAMLSMQTAEQKARIIREAARLLRPGGKYGIHELCLVPDSAPQALRERILQEMTGAVHVGVRPLTASEWTGLLEAAGLTPLVVEYAPFRLLEPSRMIRDEGLFGAIRIASRLLRDPEARGRVLAMRRTFREHRNHLSAIMIVAEKRGN